MQRIKKRFDATNQDWYYIPCYPGTLTMVEDIGSVSVSKLTLQDPNKIGDMSARFNTNPARDLSDFEDGNYENGQIKLNGTSVRAYTEAQMDALAAYSQRMLEISTAVAQAVNYNANGYYPFVKIPFMPV